MNVFISYSIDETEQYILTLLSQKVSETGFTLVTSYDQSDLVEFQAANEIRGAVLFIGLITSSGRSRKTARVYSEFQQANEYNKPAILLIEETVPVAFSINGHNTIWFNRHHIDQALDVVKDKITESQNAGLQQNSNAAAWILGGLAVVAALSLLSDKK